MSDNNDGSPMPPGPKLREATMDFIIMACPKSGTTWMQHLISSHPDAVCAESRAFGDYYHPNPLSNPHLTTEKYFNILSNYHRIEASGIGASRDSDSPSPFKGEGWGGVALASFYRRLFFNTLDTIAQTSLEATGKSVYGEKITPYNGTANAVVQRIAEYNPEIKFVNLVRDGRDVIVSGAAQWLNLRIEKAASDEERRLLHERLLRREMFEEDFTRFLANWCEVVDAGSAAKNVLRNHLELRYEALLREPDAEITRLFQFLGLRHDAAVVTACKEAASFKKLSGGRSEGEEDARSFYRKGAAGDWENWFTPEQIERFADRAGELMVMAGYTVPRLEKDAINNRNYSSPFREEAPEFDGAGRASTPPVKQTRIYVPGADWTYSHHPYITHFKGRFYAMWSSGETGEDQPGQRIAAASSANAVDWTNPFILVAPETIDGYVCTLTAAGWYVGGDTLVAYYGRYASVKLEPGEKFVTADGKRTYRYTELFVRTTSDGRVWTDPQPLNLEVIPNQPPRAISDGRLILAGNSTFSFTDDRSGRAGWQTSGFSPDIPDNPSTIAYVSAAIDAPGLCEGSFFQTKEGFIHMMLRSREKRLWHTESHNGGYTWSKPSPSEFSDGNSKFMFGRLRDGRFFYVGTPDPNGNRTPLVLSLSADGINFTKHYILGSNDYQLRFPGHNKGGQFGYPNLLEHGDSLYVIVSRQKEAIDLLTVRLADLAS